MKIIDSFREVKEYFTEVIEAVKLIPVIIRVFKYRWPMIISILRDGCVAYNLKINGDLVIDRLNSVLLNVLVMDGGIKIESTTPPWRGV